MNGSPYKGLESFVEADGPVFFGRASECKLVQANLFAAPLTILYGPSGVGKSSLLRAGVLRDLHRVEGRAAVLFDNWHSADPLGDLKIAIVGEVRRIEPGAELDPTSTLDELLTKAAGVVDGPIFLLLDQVEEYLLNRGGSAAEAFDAALARAVNRASGSLRFLVSLREDVLARLDRFEGRIPNLFDSYLRLEALTTTAARQAIVGPLAVYNADKSAEQQMVIEPELVDTILDEVGAGKISIEGFSAVPRPELAPGERRVEAPYLQLVLLRIWDYEKRHGSQTMRASTLETLGGAQQIVRTHLDTVMAALSGRQRALAARVFHFLITPSGNKIAQTAADLANYTGLAPSAVEDVLNRLSSQDVRVLRPRASDAATDEATRYEVFHDVLPPAILAWRTRYLAGSALSLRVAVLGLVVFVAAMGIQLVADLQPSVLTVVRIVAMAALNAVALQQVYRWFSRYGMSAAPSLVVAAYRGPDLGTPLGIGLTLLFSAGSSWATPSQPDGTLGTQDFGYFATYVPIVLVLTLFVGFVTFMVMVNSGYVTRRLYRNFDLGFFGAYAVAWVLIVGLSVGFLLGYVPPLITPASPAK